MCGDRAKFKKKCPRRLTNAAFVCVSAAISALASFLFVFQNRRFLSFFMEDRAGACAGVPLFVAGCLRVTAFPQNSTVHNRSESELIHKTSEYVSQRYWQRALTVSVRYIRTRVCVLADCVQRDRSNGLKEARATKWVRAPKRAHELWFSVDSTGESKTMFPISVLFTFPEI